MYPASRLLRAGQTDLTEARRDVVVIPHDRNGREVGGGPGTLASSWCILLGMKLTSGVIVVSVFLMASGVPATAQDAQLGQTAQANEPTVKSLYDIRPGVSRTAIMTGLASDYTFTKTEIGDGVGAVEYWLVASKTPPLRSADVTFRGGRVTDIMFHLMTSESPDVAKFVDILQSALYDVANPPDSAGETALGHSLAEYARAACPTCPALSDAQIAQIGRMTSKVQNRRYGFGQVVASQKHSPDLGENSELWIMTGGRTFYMQLLRQPDGRTLVSLSEAR